MQQKRVGTAGRGADGPVPGRDKMVATMVACISAVLADERDRLVLWLPVFLGLGIAVYFALGAEPPLWIGAAAVGLIGLAVLSLKRRFAEGMGAAGLALACMAALALGFAAAQMRAISVAAPVLENRIGPVTVTGRVVRIEAFAANEGARVTLERPRITRIGPERTPEKIRVRLRGEIGDVAPGDWLTVRAILMPPPPPAAPGAFDFQRHAFFLEIGGVGFALGQADIVARDPGNGLAAMAFGIERLRQDMTERVRGAIDGAAGAVAAALMTGDRAGIPAEVNDWMRDSGLAHLLSISGLHFGLVAGILFFSVRSLLVLIPGIALRYPIKKWAAAIALLGAGAYTVIAGASVPTVRSFLMLALVLVAVFADRRAISMRLVAWAAAAILLFQPENLLGASFQMSFAAVIALIAAYEWMRIRRERRQAFSGQRPWWVRVAALPLLSVAATTLIATAATAPFALYHFNRFAAYALAANMIAVPLTALWVMPWAVLAFALIPFGLESLALAPMGWGVAGIITVARETASWPGAVAVVPAMPTWGLAVAAAGGLWLCLWHGRWRVWGLTAIALGLASMVLQRVPDVLVSADGQLLAVRTETGRLALSSPKGTRLSRETWLRRAGLEEGEVDDWPLARSAGGHRQFRCDALGCLYRAEGRTVALVRDRAALAEDCWAADVVVATIRAPRACRESARLIELRDLARNGAHALWLSREGVRIESVNQERGRRPWVPAQRFRNSREPSTTP